MFVLLILVIYVCYSPKSPPNSPNTELATEDELKGVYINYSYKVNICYFVCCNHYLIHAFLLSPPLHIIIRSFSCYIDSGQYRSRKWHGQGGRALYPMLLKEIHISVLGLRDRWQLLKQVSLIFISIISVEDRLWHRTTFNRSVCRKSLRQVKHSQHHNSRIASRLWKEV